MSEARHWGDWAATHAQVLESSVDVDFAAVVDGGAVVDAACRRDGTMSGEALLCGR